MMKIFFKSRLDDKTAFSDMAIIFYSVLQKFISRFGNKNIISSQLLSMEVIDGNTPLLFAVFRGNRKRIN